MRGFALVLGAGLALPLPAMAEDVVIRIEAKRGADAAATAAQDWAGQFPDVVTFPLSDGWTGIALGPMPREQASVRLDELRAQNRVPGDSFLAPAEGRVLNAVPGGNPDAATAATPEQSAATPASASTFPAAAEPAPDAAEPATADLAGEDAPDTAPAPEMPESAAPDMPAAPEAPEAPAQFFIRIESSADRAAAEDMLAKRREILPDVGLWTLPNGRFVVALGPTDQVTGEAWLRAFKDAQAVPRDAFVTPAADLGQNEIIGKVPELGAAPGETAMPLVMPPLEDVQRALRWAGHYDGAIDGKDGPMTQAAIADEIVRLRASPDPASAMGELIRRRDAWRTQIGLTELRDPHTGLALPAPMQKLQFDRTERALSIYGPKDGSGAALILFSQPGGQQEMLDMAGLVTALGWVPAPVRQVRQGSVILDGRNQTHVGHAEGRVVDGRAQGFVLIWPLQDMQESRRIASEISDNLSRFAPGAMDPAPAETAPDTPATPLAN
ncbi:peptidoglycan-binding domain-containing protein [Paracoccus shanxieyensis]|uniref:Peptidoglycan-binding protein n=1 Tax=Paracoccus shanxieyensis TaxID=2675752 RepID=A0A6L6IWB9_9RHOB|nr:peptidoglycan-binding domain-containing protein [Paracoccus shanxieyensis]MTH62657.1 peptidoglycan-binding protein [Paracoccus shanxieyensis]MTH86259.1 peptidoglycan-binding protein [Paracoccus shanxieyensis]